jgi:hypothetical protein
MSIYSIAEEICNETHMREIRTPSSDNTAYKTFSQYYNPLVMMAFTSEWGGHSNFKYSLFPAVAWATLEKYDVDPTQFTVENTSNDSYIGPAITSVTSPPSNYRGPGQVAIHLEGSLKGKMIEPYVGMEWYTDGVVGDPFKWSDVCEWYTHMLAYSMSSTWNKSHQFKNTEEVIAITSLAVNTGTGILANESGGGSFATAYAWFVWKDAQAAWDYAGIITEQWFLDAIKVEALNRYNEDVEAIRSGNASSRTMQWDANDCFTWVESTLASRDIELSTYVYEMDSKQLHEKVMHPVHAIWAYYQMVWHYSGGATT